MLMESFVAIMAMIAATVLEPGVYFAMNSPGGLIGTTAAQAAQVISGWGFAVTPDMLTQTRPGRRREDTCCRAPAARRRSRSAWRRSCPACSAAGVMMAIWYHFAILFEALFILTTVDAGTRVARFMMQDLIGTVVPAFKNTRSWANNVIGSALACAAWGYFLYQGVIDPLGGINTLWPLFGISNQMLAGIALILCTVVLFKMKRERYAWVTIVPTAWLLICTLTAGLEKILHPAPASASSPMPRSSARRPPPARSSRRRRL